MCKAFSCIVDQIGKVTWRIGVDSHSELARIGGYADRELGEFAKVEITPKNGNYLYPDEWVYRVDESPVPKWCGIQEKELCIAAHKKWLQKLDKIILRHPIVHPFKVDPPKIGPREILLLKKWDSVGDSVWAYMGSFFRIPVWKYVKHPKGKYPYQPLVDLWNKGLVPSFDGKTWRLHGGADATILFKISKEELKSAKTSKKKKTERRELTWQ